MKDEHLLTLKGLFCVFLSFLFPCNFPHISQRILEDVLVPIGRRCQFVSPTHQALKPAQDVWVIDQV